MGPAGMWIGMISGLTSGAVLLFGRFWARSAQTIREQGATAAPS